MIKKLNLKNNDLIVYTLIIILIFIIYAPSLKFYFTLDDSAWLSFSKKFFEYRNVGETPSLFFRRFTMNSLLYLEYLMFGNKSEYFHLTNIILFTVNAILLYHFSMFFLKNPFKKSFAIFTTLLFILLPSRFDVVNWISCQCYLILGILFMFTILTFYKFIKTHKKKFYVVTFILCFLSILTHQVGLILPVLLAIEYVLFDKNSEKVCPKISATQKFIYFLPFVLLIIAYFQLNYGNLFIFFHRIYVSSIEVLVKNMIFFIILIIFSVYILGWRSKAEKFFYLWTILALSPYIMSVAEGYTYSFIIGGRWYYIASIGFCILIFSVMQKILTTKKRYKIVSALIWIVLSVLIVYDIKYQLMTPLRDATHYKDFFEKIKLSNIMIKEDMEIAFIDGSSLTVLNTSPSLNLREIIDIGKNCKRNDLSRTYAYIIYVFKLEFDVQNVTAYCFNESFFKQRQIDNDILVFNVGEDDFLRINLNEETVSFLKIDW